jgi:hypothetical protein
VLDPVSDLARLEGVPSAIAAALAAVDWHWVIEVIVH